MRQNPGVSTQNSIETSILASSLVSSPPSNPRQILTVEALSQLNQRSNLKGFLQLAGHIILLLISGSIWVVWATDFIAPYLGETRETILPPVSAWLALPAIVIYGFGLAAMFATLHECSHRTAFADNRWNDGVAWFAGLLSFYNSTFYRRYHKWHHRYTQLPGQDPELSDPKPTHWQAYFWELSGLPWWMGKLRGHGQVALGLVQEYPFLPETAYKEVILSTRLQLFVYTLAIVLSLFMGHPEAILIYWILPLAVGQPILRFILLAEHTNCSNDDNPLTNTRTTLTLAPLRFLMWNMPFHTEHHLYPSIPFHALPQAHLRLRPYLSHLVSGYVTVHQHIVAPWRKAP